MVNVTNNYIVLSRKYRPQILQNLIGQDILVTSLKNSIENNKVPHAFLFYGIRGIGKTTTARILARCLNCLENEIDDQMTSSPCGICKSCKAMNNDSHLDVLEIDAASRTGVDDVREIIDTSQYMPVLGRYKIFIIDEVHMLSKSAFNALLKTLEEPPAQVKFIFATTEIHKVPETILSRCMTFNLKPVSNDIISKYILDISDKEGLSIEKEAAELIALESEGSVRDSLSLLDQAIMFSTRKNTITKDTIISMTGGVKYADIENLIEIILSAKTREALAQINVLSTGGCDIYTIYRAIQTVIYKKIVEKVYSAQKVSYSLSHLLYMWQIFINQTKNIKITQYPEQILNATIVIMSHTSSFPDVEQLIVKDELDSSNSKNPTIQQVSDLITSSETSLNNNDQLIENILKYFPGSSVTELE